MALTVGIGRAAIGEVYAGYYLICQIGVVYINAAIKDGDTNVCAAFGNGPSLRSLNFCHSPLHVKIWVIGDIHSLSYTINLDITHLSLHTVRCYLRGPLPAGNCNYLNSNLRECPFNISAHPLVHFGNIARACARLEFDQKTFSRWIPRLVVSGR